MRGLTATATIVAILLGSGAALAQRGGGGNEATPLGRQGYQWETEQALEKERIQKLTAELETLSEEEWKDRALAWLKYSAPDENGLSLDRSHRIAGVDAGKKAQVTPVGRSGTAWTVAYGKKPPRELKVTMTDVNSTRVTCPLTPTQKDSEGYIGVFLYEGVLMCVTRTDQGGAG